MKEGKYNLSVFNKNGFWLRSHWVKSSDKPIPKISDKYAVCF